MHRYTCPYIIYIHTNACVHIHIPICTDIYVYTNKETKHAYVRTHTHTHVHVCVRTSLCVCVCVWNSCVTVLHACMSRCMHVYVHACMHVCATMSAYTFPCTCLLHPCIFRVPDQNGESRLYNMLEMYQSGREPSILSFIKNYGILAACVSVCISAYFNLQIQKFASVRLFLSLCISLHYPTQIQSPTYICFYFGVCFIPPCCPSQEPKLLH